MYMLKALARATLAIFISISPISVYADDLTPMPMTASISDKLQGQTSQEQRTVTLYPKQRKASLLLPIISLLATSALLYSRLTAPKSSSPEFYNELVSAFRDNIKPSSPTFDSQLFDEFKGISKDYIAGSLIAFGTFLTTASLVDIFFPGVDILEKNESDTSNEQEVTIQIADLENEDKEIECAKHQYSICMNAKNFPRCIGAGALINTIGSLGLLSLNAYVNDKKTLLYSSAAFALLYSAVMLIHSIQDIIAPEFHTTDASNDLHKKIKDAQEQLKIQQNRFNEIIPLALNRGGTHAFKTLRKHFMNQPENQTA